VPVPQVLEHGQIHIGERRLFERLDAYSAPRLAEYHDPDPCAVKVGRMMGSVNAQLPASVAKEETKRRNALGVTVEAAYTVGEYDIVMLSAKQSDGLETWLRENGYRIPKGASAALRPYVRQNMKFFVAKVNLKEQAKTGVASPAPLPVASSPTGSCCGPAQDAQREGAAGSCYAMRLRTAVSRRRTTDGEAAGEPWCRRSFAASSPKRTRRCSTHTRRARTTAPSSPNTFGTWAGATRVPPITHSRRVAPGRRVPARCARHGRARRRAAR
jgi:hypothetical protein